MAPLAFHVYLLEGKARGANPQNVSGNMKRALLLLSIIGILVSCNSEVKKDNVSIEEIGFNVLKSIKENDKQGFLALFDQKVLAQTPPDQIDTAFNFYKNLLADYDFPTVDVWKKEKFFCQVDTVKRIVAIGLPLINATNSKVDFIFELQFSSENQLTGINLNKTADPEVLPDSHFPPKEDEFNYSFDSLLSIKLYSLPGLNSNPQLSKYIAYERTEFTSEIKSDFGKILTDLNQSAIIGSEKTISQQPNSNDLKAVIFIFRDNGKERSLFLISNEIDEHPLDIHTFYVTNATYAYHVNDSCTALLKEDISVLVGKYVK